MSFASQFEDRWINVIAPAIKSIVVDGKPLSPIRVDASKISESILTEILGGIANSLLVLADISTQGYVDKRPMRNENVMYELGLTHATRLPQEVLVFRSDDDRLSFDVANIRVNHYEPDSAPEDAQKKVASAIEDALQSVKQEKSQAVQMAVRGLDAKMLDLIISLAQVPNKSLVSHGQLVSKNKKIIPIIQLGQAIPQLLSARIIEAGFLSDTRENVTKLETIGYRLTSFGMAVKNVALVELAVNNQAVRKAVAEALSSPVDETT